MRPLVLATVGIEQRLLIVFGEVYAALRQLGPETFPLLVPAEGYALIPA